MNCLCFIASMWTSKSQTELKHAFFNRSHEASQKWLAKPKQPNGMLSLYHTLGQTYYEFFRMISKFLNNLFEKVRIWKNRENLNKNAKVKLRKMGKNGKIVLWKIAIIFCPSVYYQIINFLYWLTYECVAEIHFYSLLMFGYFAGKWGYHRQGSCQAGLGAAIADVSTFE